MHLLLLLLLLGIKRHPVRQVVIVREQLAFKKIAAVLRYKQNAAGSTICKVVQTTSAEANTDKVDNINTYSYLLHVQPYSAKNC
jgi:hypothetical protein